MWYKDISCMTLRYITKIAVIGFLIVSFLIWYLLFITPIFANKSIHYESDFMQIYGTILFMAIPSVLLIVFERILIKFTEFQLFVCCGITSWVNLLLWVLNPDEIYKWYNRLAHGKK